jgi:uncharacterized protein with NAD-binding domain and iron-sulfur cluster
MKIKSLNILDTLDNSNMTLIKNVGLQRSVVIIGGGIAGLTAAHELVELGYKVTLLERNNIVGGLARTYQNKKDKTCPYEYSWRAYGKWYQNVYNIMKRISYDEKKTVYDKINSSTRL